MERENEGKKRENKEMKTSKKSQVVKIISDLI